MVLTSLNVLYDLDLERVWFKFGLFSSVFAPQLERHDRYTSMRHGLVDAVWRRRQGEGRRNCWKQRHVGPTDAIQMVVNEVWHPHRSLYQLGQDLGIKRFAKMVRSSKFVGTPNNVWGLVRGHKHDGNIATTGQFPNLRQ